MAWIEKHGKGHRVRWDAEGGGTSSGPTLASREEAEAWGVLNGHIQRERMTLSKLTDKWCELRPLEGNPIDPATPYWVRQQMLAIIRDRGWTFPADVTPAAIDQWRIDTGGKGVRSNLVTLLMVLRWGVAHRLIAGISPEVLTMRLPPKNKDHHIDRLLTDDQVLQLQDRAAAIGPQAMALVHYLSTYGARPITAARLLISDVDWTAETLRLRHVKRRRPFIHALLPQTVRIFSAIAHGRSDDSPLFLDPRTGEPWKVTKQGSVQTMNSWYFRAISRGNRVDKRERVEPSRIYDLKRFAITTMLRRGIDPPTVQTITGHLTLAQVLKYARTNEERSREALAKLGVDVKSASAAATQADHPGHPKEKP